MRMRFSPPGIAGRKPILSFAFGICFGFSVAHVLMNMVSWEMRKDRLWNSICTFSRLDVRDPDKASAGSRSEVTSHGDKEEFHEGESVVADQLAKEVRVLCWVMTAPANHASKAKAVKSTWGRRCNVLLFMSSAEDPELPTIALKVEEGRNHLWAKTKRAFVHVHDHYLDKADWFMKADDDTYVVLENLRYMLRNHSPDSPIYFGRQFFKFIDQGYMSGGAGYVLSRESLKRLVRVGLPDQERCWEASAGNEDVEAGKCLRNVGVVPANSRDKMGRGRFFPFSPEMHLIPGYVDEKNWYWDYTNTSYKEGGDCCSDTAVSFHYISPEMMQLFDYLIYHLRPYGITRKLDEIDIRHLQVLKSNYTINSIK